MQNRYKIIFILLIALICLMVVLKNSKDGLLIGGDIGARSVYPIETLKDAFSMWCGNEGPGRDNSYSTTYIIPSLFLAFLKTIGFSQTAFTNIFFFFLIFIPAVTCYLLIRYLLAKGKDNLYIEFCGFVGCLFYIFNLYTRFLFGSPWGHLTMVYSFLPITLLFFIKGMDSSGNSKRIYYAILSGISFIFIFSCNLAHTAAALMIIAMYIIFYMFSQRIKIIAVIKFTLLVCLICTFTLAFFILPIISSNSLSSNLQRNIDLGWFSPGSWLYKNTSFLNLFRMVGTQDPPLGFYNFIYSPTCLVLSYLAPIITFSSLFWLRRNKNIIFFILLAIIGLFLAKGCHNPFGTVFYIIGKIFPPFTILKGSFDKLTVLITMGYTLAISFSVQQILRILSIQYKKCGAIAAGIIILPVFICEGWPFFNGSLGTKDYFLKMPESYNKTVDYVNNKKGDFKVFSVPAVEGSWNRYNWGYVGMEPLIAILNKPLVESFRVQGNVFRTLIDNSSYWQMCRLLRLFNIKYLLLRNDFVDYPAAKTMDALKLGRGLEKKEDFGGINIFKVNPRFYCPHIYTGMLPVLVFSDDTDDIYPVCYSKYLRPSTVLFFSRDNKNTGDIVKNDPSMDAVIYFNSDSDNGGISKWTKQIEEIKKHEPGILDRTKTAYVFRKNSEFYIEEDCWFKVKAMVSARPYIAKRKAEGFRMRFNDLARYDINVCNAEYSYSVDEDGILAICADFDGDRYEDEFIQLSTKNIKTNIQEYPYFYLRYKVENAKVQTVEIVMDIDLNGDKIADDTIKGLYPNPASEKYDSYVINVYELVKERHPDIDQCSVINLGIYPHKMWWTDCSEGKGKGRYKFWLKDAGFYGYPVSRGHSVINKVLDIKGKFNYWRYKYTPSVCELINKESEITLASKCPYVEISRDFDGVNIGDYSFLYMKYYLKDPKKIESIDLIVGLDGGEDFEIPNLPVAADFNKYTANIKNIINDRYVEAKNYVMNKLTLKIKLKGEIIGDDNILTLNKIWLYNKKFNPSDGYIFKKPVFRIDENMYKFIKKYKTMNDSLKTMFEKKIFLRKGSHYIESIIEKDLEFVILEPENNVEIPKNIGVSSKRISSTRYEVVLKADKSCWLVFSESFNPKWKAYFYKAQMPNAKRQMKETEDKRQSRFALRQMWKDRGKRFELKEHYKVNGYANAWYVPEIQNKEINIVIEYIPQRFFELGCIISGLSLCAGGVLLLWIRRKRIF